LKPLDNEATVAILKKGCSKSIQIMPLVRKLTMITAEQNFMFFAQYLPGKLNSIADSLSRLQMDRFCKLAPKAKETSCKVPGPEDILWNSNQL
jgi:hypothetical protein